MKKVLSASSFQRKLESSISFIFKSVLDSSFRWNDDESTDLIILGQTGRWESRQDIKYMIVDWILAFESV